MSTYFRVERFKVPHEPGGEQEEQERARPYLQKNSQRREDDGEDELEDIGAGKSHGW